MEEGRYIFCQRLLRRRVTSTRRDPARKREGAYAENDYWINKTTLFDVVFVRPTVIIHNIISLIITIEICSFRAYSTKLPTQI